MLRKLLDLNEAEAVAWPFRCPARLSGAAPGAAASARDTVIASQPPAASGGTTIGTEFFWAATVPTDGAADSHERLEVLYP